MVSKFAFLHVFRINQRLNLNNKKSARSRWVSVPIDEINTRGEGRERVRGAGETPAGVEVRKGVAKMTHGRRNSCHRRSHRAAAARTVSLIYDAHGSRLRDHISRAVQVLNDARRAHFPSRLRFIFLVFLSPSLRSSAAFVIK